jgi:hypothetical protein
MGTRASFWIGDPRDLNNRTWLGCVAWDGYPEGDIETLKDAKSPEEFAGMIGSLAQRRDDFTSPIDSGWPFPWDGDVFLTDYTYAWIDGGIQIAHYHSGFFTWPEWEKQQERDDALPDDVPAPAKYDPEHGKDSLILLTIPTS